MRTSLLVALALLGGCDCGYGGPGCGNPWALGLCAPVVQVDVPASIEISYGDDTGLHPSNVLVRRVFQPTRLGVWPGTTTGSLTVLGLEVGTADVELDIEGWGAVPVQFEVGTEPAPTGCEVDYDQPGFPIDVNPEG